MPAGGGLLYLVCCSYVKLTIKRFDDAFPLPTPTDGAACFDFFTRETITIEPGKIGAVKLNAAIKVPAGYALLVFSRSSTALRKGLMLANGVGVVDPFYSGDNDENLAFLHNITDEPVTIEAGDRVVQGMIIKTAPVIWDEVESMNDGGHGGYQHLDELDKPKK